MAIGEGAQHDGIGWPPVSSAKATLQIPSSVKTVAFERHGGSIFRKRRTREIVWGKQGPTKHVKESKEMGSTLGEEAHLPQSVVEAVRVVSGN